MPTRNEDSTLYYQITEDGGWIPVSGVPEVRITDNSSIFPDCRKEYTITIDITNKFHMGKKRFKKILMSRGISRNDAEILCENIKACCGAASYRDVYLRTIFRRQPKVCFSAVCLYIYSYYSLKEKKSDETQTD